MVSIPGVSQAKDMLKVGKMVYKGVKGIVKGMKYINKTMNSMVHIRGEQNDTELRSETANYICNIRKCLILGYIVSRCEKRNVAEQKILEAARLLKEAEEDLKWT